MRLNARRRPARWGLLVVALVLALVAAGCGHKSAAKVSAKGSATATSSGTTLPAVWPLTGLPMNGAAPKHPPVIVKMDNTEASRPQEGLGKADLVTEELVEGGLTRLAVFFDTRIPTLVGPVRSMRASDIGLVKPVKGVVVTSGAAAPTIARLNGAHVNFKSNDGGAPGFFRESGRRAPYNLLMHLRELVKTLKPVGTTAPYLPWGTDADFTGTQAATSITAHFGGGHTTDWSFRGGKYVNTNSNADADGQFHPDTVVVVRVKIKDAGYTDPAGNFVPESVTTGKGNAAIFHDGKMETATWSKSGPTSGWTFADASGKALKVPAGHTWIEVMPVKAKGGNLSFR